jgi:hypothetical protein
MASYDYGVIDSGAPVDIGVEVSSQGGVDSGDYVRLYRVMDGGNEVLIREVKGKQAKPAAIRSTATGSKLILIIRIRVSASDKVLRMDHLTVTPRWKLKIKTVLIII